MLHGEMFLQGEREDLDFQEVTGDENIEVDVD